MINTKKALDHWVSLGADREPVYQKIYKSSGGKMPDYFDIPLFEALIDRALVSGKADIKGRAEVLKAMTRPELRTYLEAHDLWVENPPQAQATQDDDNEPIIGSKFEGHIGMVFLRNATAQLIFAAVALIFQSIMWSILFARVFAGVSIGLMKFNPDSGSHWALAISAGIIFEACGIFVGANFNNRKVNFMGESISARSLWLWAFFIVQVTTDLCVTGVIQSEIVAEIIIGVSMPLPVIVYANLFMKENREA